MLARAGGYCGAAFTGARGVMKGDPLYPAIFNLVVDAVVRHCMSVMVEGAEERGKHEQEGRDHNNLLYTDDGTFASLDPRWFQGAFSTLVGLL